MSQLRSTVADNVNAYDQQQATAALQQSVQSGAGTVTAAINAEFERALIRGRQREGVALAKEQGVYKGRRPPLSDVQLAKEFVISRETYSLTAMVTL